MKYLLVLITIVFFGCTPSKDNKNTEFPKSPTKEEEIPEVIYDSLESNILLTETNSLKAFTEVVLGSQNLNFQIKITAQNTVGEVFSLNAPMGATVSNDCDKAYLLNETCLVNVQLNSSFSRTSLIIRASTSKGLKFFIVKVKKINSTGVGAVTINNDGNIDLGLMIGRQNVQKIIIVKNTGGADLSDLNVAIKGKDSQAFKIIINSCNGRLLKTGQSCSVRVRTSAQFSGNGIYESRVEVTSPNLPTISSKTLVGEIQQSSVTSSPPSVTGLNNLKIAAESTLVINPQITGSTETWTFSLAPNSLNLIINESSGEINFLPTLAQQGVHNLTLFVSNGKSPAFPVNFNIEVFPKVISSGSLFTEGEVLDPLMTLDIQGNKEVQSITSNINNYFTIVKISGTGILGQSTHLINQNQIPVKSGTTNNINYSFAGAVKFFGNFNIDFNITFKDNSTYTFSKAVQINSANLPYMKYDIWAVKSADGYHATSMYASVRELKREYTGWRTPILMRFKNEDLVCNGIALTSFQANDNSQQECLKNNSSGDAETGYFFYDVYSGTSLIGGIANGTRASFVVQAIPYAHTLSHELGHQLGLWHTFETAWNDPLIAHCDNSNINSCFLRPLYRDHLNQGYDIIGDWAFYKVDYDATEGIGPYSFAGIADDTPMDLFNAKVVTLNNLYCPPFFPVYCNPGYSNGTSALLWYGGQSWTTSSGGHACSQNVGSNTPYPAPVTCSNVPGLGSVTLQEDAVKNTMSYWYHTVDSARFTSGQKNRMNKVLQDHPELTNP